MKPTSPLSDEERAYALSVLNDFYRGDIAKAARYLQMSVATLKQLQKQAEREAAPKPHVITGRPMPPDVVLDPDNDPQFAPALELLEWIRQTFLNPSSPLYNEAHDHLEDAQIGLLWTNVTYRRQGRYLAGLAEMPSCQGNLWLKMRVEWQLSQWFDALPDFLITLHAPTLGEVSDATFCALIEHELYHCAQREDMFGGLAFNKLTGQPLYYLKGHDVEEFIGVVQRYGAGNASANVGQLVMAGSKAPAIAPADIALACGTCGAKL